MALEADNKIPQGNNGSSSSSGGKKPSVSNHKKINFGKIFTFGLNDTSEEYKDRIYVESKLDRIRLHAASVFFAVDRFASFRKDWKAFYDEGGIIIADRYVTSNLVHQAGKIDDAEEKERYIHWLNELEYGILGLPKADCVIFLDMPPAYSLKLRQERNALKQGLTNDIHEADQTYLQKAYDNAIGIAKHQGWHTISCVAHEQIRTIEDIHAEIVQTIRNM